MVTIATRTRLDERLAAERARAKEIRNDPQWWVTEDMRTKERARIRAQLRAHLAGLRQRGELLDRVDVLVTHAVRLELAAREWNRDWPPVPDTAPKASRWPGSMAGGWPAQVRALIPAEYAERVHAGCWHTSADAIEALRDWRDAHPEIITEFSTPTLWAEYKALADRVTTPGKVWRAALGRVLFTS